MTTASVRRGKITRQVEEYLMVISKHFKSFLTGFGESPFSPFQLSRVSEVTNLINQMAKKKAEAIVELIRKAEPTAGKPQASF
ncbi:unnamed protein product [Clonostachys solani]|uniref:Uncharacterized protein n=1 Tax=Clonostachys solani TaxID=160281 RepID=A0A9P0EL12_9HYPO|nr:unnamed protein product [Clonostachys solani]